VTLATYKAKRNFHQTPEPKARPGKRHKEPMFVVQEHHASRLHYDFRLEADGVLKSWAVPKGPSMDPAQKRLAVHVEDHPLEYANFHGTIPEGQYGAGTVAIWDRGTYENLLAEKPESRSMVQGIEEGRLEFVLHGRKLQGRFALIRTRGLARGKDNWLLIKMKDEFARGNGAAQPRRAPKTQLVKAASSSKSIRDSSATAEARKSPALFEFSRVDKIMFPESGITKGDVIEYYLNVADRLLPYLRDRPATLERFPDGIDSTTRFWQKNTPKYYPDWIERVNLPSEGRSVNYVLVNKVETLAYLVNQGTLTFHVGFSRIQSLDQPDFVLFDLDPGQASFADVVRVAKKLREFLNNEDLTSYIKTSGKTGLHVFTPWANSAGGYDESRAWALLIARCVVKALPDIATVERSKAERGKRVYVDVMQNSVGKHAVPPYVLRGVAGAPVSTPLEWGELTVQLDPRKFKLKTIARRLSRKIDDPMRPLLDRVVR
jgi:bifunctional non-homologous end joining protein LigD